MTFRINVKTIKGDKLTFKGVLDYELQDGFLKFKDQKNGETKRFHPSNCEVEEEIERIEEVEEE